MRYRTFRLLSYLILIVPFLAIVYRFGQQIERHADLHAIWLRQASFFLPLIGLILFFFGWDIYRSRRAKRRR